MEAKKIFISYSWGMAEHQERVRELGTRLMEDGIETILDQWSLKEGQDINFFMETIVKDKTIDRVLIICDKNYASKADERRGGVGSETQILTPEIYGKTQQEKFIPIVFERDAEDNAYLPIFLKTRKYIDLSREEYYEEEYEKLVRNIYEAPEIKKPKLGKAPSYITEEKKHNSSTYFHLKALDSQLNKNPSKVNTLLQDFLDDFLDNLWHYKIEDSPNTIDEYGEFLLNNLGLYKELRDDYIQFLLKITREGYELNVDRLINFFEKKSKYNSEIFSIIFHELFLYTIAICIKNNNYSLVADLLNSGYYFENNYMNQSNLEKFYNLYDYHESLENYYRRIENRVTGFGEYIITNIYGKFNKSEIILADMLCHYCSELQKGNDYKTWFPCTYGYSDRHYNFDFFIRLSSKRFFDKVKDIFNAKDINEFNSIIIEYENKIKTQKISNYGYSSAWSYIPFIFEIINVNKIASER